jgi:hypothetical protein
MNKLTVEEKQEILLDVLRHNDEQFAVFGIEKEVAMPLVKKGLLHKDTFRFTGGCKLTTKGRI